MATEKVINVKAETKEAVKEVEKLNKTTEETGKQAKEASKDFSGIGETIDKVTGGAVSGFKNMLGGVKGLTGGFKGLKGAIVATGIGALVVLLTSAFEWFKNTEAGAKLLDQALNAIGAVVGQLGKAFQALINFDFAGVKEAFSDMGTEINNAVQATNNLYDAQERLFNLQKTQIVQNQKLRNEQELLRRVIQDTTLSDEERIKAIERLNEVNEKLLKSEQDELALKREIAQANLDNENNEEKRRELSLEIQQIKSDELELENQLILINEDAEQKRREILEATKAEEESLQADREKRKEDRIRQQEELAKATEQARIKNLKDEEARIEAEFQLEIAGIRKKYGKGTELEAELEKSKNAKIAEINEQERIRLQEKRLEQLQLDKDFEQLQFEEKRERLKQQAELIANDEVLTEEQKSQKLKEIAAKEDAVNKNQKNQEQKREEALADFKVKTAFNVLNSLQSIAEEGSAGAKAIAVAQAVLSTYQGINKALAETTDFTPTQTLRFANAAAVGIAGIANVKKILSTNPKKSSGGAAKPSTPSSGASSQQAQQQVQAPEFNIVGDSGTNQIAEVLGEQSKKPQKAFVVSKEVSSQQELDRNIETSASLG